MKTQIIGIAPYRLRDLRTAPRELIPLAPPRVRRDRGRAGVAPQPAPAAAPAPRNVVPFPTAQRLDPPIGWAAQLEIRGRIVGRGGATVRSGAPVTLLDGVLSRLDGIPEHQDLVLIIDSHGGNADAAERMYYAIRARSGRISARVTGVCASAAVHILLAADRRECVAEAKFLLHTCAIDPADMPPDRWTADVHRQIAACIERADADAARFYATCLRMDARRIRDIMREERVLDATDAQRLGLVHEVLGR